MQTSIGLVILNTFFKYLVCCCFVALASRFLSVSYKHICAQIVCTSSQTKTFFISLCSDGANKHNDVRTRKGGVWFRWSLCPTGGKKKKQASFSQSPSLQCLLCQTPTREYGKVSHLHPFVSGSIPSALADNIAVSAALLQLCRTLHLYLELRGSVYHAHF